MFEAAVLSLHVKLGSNKLFLRKKKKDVNLGSLLQNLNYIPLSSEGKQ